MPITTETITNDIEISQIITPTFIFRTGNCAVRMHWPRWAFASITKHFNDAAVLFDIPMFIEGTHRFTKSDKKYIEIRIDGPNIVEVSKNYFRFDIHINVLWAFNQDNEDFHEPQRIIGMLAVAMDDICVYRYGSAVFDDSSVLGTLQLKQGAISNNFGQVRSDVKLIQGTVEGTYRMYISCN